MGKKIMVLALAAIMMIGVFGLSGCDGSSYDPYEDSRNPVVESECGNFFVQLYNEDKNGVQKGNSVILELTDAGKTKEVLVIPSQVEGRPVTQIGLPVKVDGSVYPQKYWGIESTNLKLYVPYSVSTLAVSIGGLMSSHKFPIHCNEIVFISEIAPTVMLKNKTASSDLDSAVSAIVVSGLFLEESTPNLIYRYNYTNAENSGYFWVDYLTGGNPSLDPHSPMRDGYTFTGWYLESECVTQWDGVKPSSINEKLDLFAGWDKSGGVNKKSGGFLWVRK